jgi:hypothetical protein
MSTLALSLPHRDTGFVRTALDGLVRRRGVVTGFVVGFPVVFYVLLLAALVIRYGDLPNYVTPYNWPANVWHIIVSTGSLADIVKIAADEWLLEIGSMNYEYGNGIADWSLSILPHKLLILCLSGALIGLNVALLLEQKTIGTLRQQIVQACQLGLLASAGALGASVTNATVFSVVHCATPSWVGSLAVLGFDSYDLFAIEPYGPVICAAGLAALAAATLLIVRDGASAADPVSQSIPREAAPC